MPKHPFSKAGKLLEEKKTVFHIRNHISAHIWQEAADICARQTGGREENTGLQAHLSGRHILEGDMAIG